MGWIIGIVRSSTIAVDKRSSQERILPFLPKIGVPTILILHVIQHNNIYNIT